MIQKQIPFLVFALGTLLISFHTMGQSATPPSQGEALWVQGGPYRLFARAFSSKKLSSHPILVVVLHGDGPPPYEHPGYQYIFASKVAGTNQNVVAVGLVRPGYTDPKGNHSEGDIGYRDGDNWNARDTDAIAAAIGQLKRRYKAEKVIVAGHSGGAAITANILGRHPRLIDAALLVSCPCGYVNDWRQSVFRLTGMSLFKGKLKVPSLSPIAQIKDMSDQVPVVLMTGTKDKVAPLKFAEQYQAKATKAGKNVTLIKLQGRPHNTFLYSKVFAEVGVLIHMQESGSSSGKQ